MILPLKEIFADKNENGKKPLSGFSFFKKRLSPPFLENKLENKKELLMLAFFILSGFGSLFFLGNRLYRELTVEVPSPGGEYIEGILGQPRFINPIYSSLNDADRDLVQLLFSGLMTYDSKGKIIPDLAESCHISSDGLVYDLKLKNNLFWSDGEELTADDVIFTIKTIQSPDYKSPLRTNWLTVEAKKISDRDIRFTLRNPYGPFLESLTVKIMPEHIWQEISAQNFPLSSYNLSPITSGPYQLGKINEDKNGKIVSLVLEANQKHHFQKPYLSKIIIKFFENEDWLLEAAAKKEIQGFSLAGSKNQEKAAGLGLKLYQFSLPRYFALFMNPSENETLQDENVRLALNYAVDKKELLAKAFLGRGEIIDGYLFPEIDGQNKAIVGYDFDKEKAEEILDKAGFVVNGSGLREKPTEETTPSEIKSELKLGSQGAEVRKLQECLSDPSVGGEEVYPERKITGFFDEATKQAVIAFQEKYSDQILKPSGLAHGTGTVGKATRAKINELCEKLPAKTSLLSFTITTVNQPLLIDIANIIKEQWQKIGVEAKIEALEIETIERDVVKPRNYEMLVFGEALGLIPDPFPFWHSSQKKDPGLNLSLYENKQADKLLEEARLAIKESERNEKLKEFQELLLAEVPAIFLCRPDYSYWTSPAIKGIGGKIISDPSKRFININQWHIYNDRKLK